MKTCAGKGVSAILLDTAGIGEGVVATPGLTDREAQRTSDIVTALRLQFEEILVVTARPRAFSAIDAEVIGNFHPELGLVDALYSGLFFVSNESAFVGTCEMPCVDTMFIAYMIRRLDRYDAVIPRSRHGLHLLHALYSGRCTHRIEAQIKDGRTGLDDLVRRARVLEIGPEEIAAHSSRGVELFADPAQSGDPLVA